MRFAADTRNSPPDTIDVPEKLIVFLGKQTPSLPDARPHSDRFRCGGRESEFLAERQKTPSLPTPVRVLSVH